MSDLDESSSREVSPQTPLAGPSTSPMDTADTGAIASGSGSSTSPTTGEASTSALAADGADDSTTADAADKPKHPPLSLDCKRLLMRLVDDGLLDLRGVAKGGPMSLRTARHLRSQWLAGNHSLSTPRPQGRPKKLSDSALEDLRTIVDADRAAPLLTLQEKMEQMGHGVIDKSTLSRMRKSMGMATRTFVRAKKGEPSMSKKAKAKAERARFKEARMLANGGHQQQQQGEASTSAAATLAAAQAQAQAAALAQQAQEHAHAQDGYHHGSHLPSFDHNGGLAFPMGDGSGDDGTAAALLNGYTTSDHLHQHHQ